MKVVIVGGGFAGTVAARAIPKKHHVELVDPGHDFEWIPNLHEILSSTKRPSALRIPRRRLLAETLGTPAELVAMPAVPRLLPAWLKRLDDFPLSATVRPPRPPAPPPGPKRRDQAPTFPRRVAGRR